MWQNTVLIFTNKEFFKKARGTVVQANPQLEHTPKFC